MVKVKEQVRCKYFKIQELVSVWALANYSEEDLWARMDENLLELIDEIREHFPTGMIINSYKNGLYQRGLRLNWDPMVRQKKGYYASSHCLGKAVDFHIANVDTKDVYDYLVKNHKKFKHLRRIEDISFTKKPGRKGWIHIDVINAKEPFKIFKPGRSI